MVTRLILLVISFFISANLYANVHNLVNEFLSSNHLIKTNRSRILLANHDFEIVNNKRPFILGLNSTLSDSNLAAISAVQEQDVTFDSYNVNLSKEFLWGGKVIVANKLIRYDRTNTSEVVLAGANPIVSEFKHSLSYSQDLGDNFLGRISKADALQAEYNLLYTSSDVEKVEQLSLFSFYSGFIDARLKKSFVELEKRAWKRSIRRKKLIAKRVRDGLRERADLLQAKMEEISKHENVQRATIDLKQSLDNLSSNLHRKVYARELKEFNLTNYKMVPIRQNKINNNLDIQSSDNLLKVLQVAHQKTEYSVFPKVNIVASYTSNSFEDSDKDALKNGTIGDQSEKVLAVNFSWPIGFEMQKQNRAKALINLKSEEYRYSVLVKNVENSRLLLMNELKILEENLISVKKRRFLAFKLLKEYTKLYNLGKADIDQVIRSEEGLIGTEKSYASYIATREIKIAKLKVLEGSLHQFLDSKE